MERDFLGVVKAGGRGKETSSKEEAKQGGFCSRFVVKDSVGALPSDSPLVSPQWPFLDKMPLQQFMTIEGSVQEERHKKIAYDQISSFGFGAISTADAFEMNHRASTAAKKNFTLDANGLHIGQGSHFGFPCATYPAQDVGQRGSMSQHSPELSVFPVSNQSMSGSMSSHYYNKLYAAAASASSNGHASVKTFRGLPVTTHPGSVSAPYTAMSVPAASAKPTPTAQLTIFYGGSVHVFDDVSLEKAQSIMFFAGNGAASAGNAQNLVAPTTKTITNGFHGNMMKSTCSRLSSPASGTSQLQPSAGHSGAQSAGGSTSTDEVMAIKTISSLTCKIQQEPSKATPATSSATLAPTAVPQARKASLARFLEKRKERLTTVSPYAKPPEACKESDHAVPHAILATSAGE